MLVSSDPFHQKRCKTLSKNLHDEMTKEERLSLRKFQMLQRRDNQRSRVSDLDARLRYFSKNSLPEYRKPTLARCQKGYVRAKPV